jgi:Flp pilus assembly protein TadG
MIKDKKGVSMVIWFLLVFIIVTAYIGFQFNTIALINERSKLYAIADESADKAAEELYEYQTDPLKNNGNVDLNTGLQMATNKAVSVFSQYGLTLNNPSAHFDKGYLVIDGTVSTPYMNPVLSSKGKTNIVFNVEGRALIRKVK